MVSSKHRKERLKDLSNIQKNFQAIGPIIKKAREEKNISLSFLSEVLKINEDYLIAIEEGDKNALPELVYVKAMVRKIFERLEIESFQEELTSASESLEKEKIIRNEVKKSRPINLYLVLSSLSLTAIILGAYSTRFILKFSSGVVNNAEIIDSASK